MKSEVPTTKRMATGVITYLENGKEHQWSIGCLARETSEDMKNHLARWRPKAQFLSAKIIPDHERQQN